MNINPTFDTCIQDAATAAEHFQDPIYPRSFSCSPQTNDCYLSEPATRALAEFFHAKGLTTLKLEDRSERWYQDWIDYQAAHRAISRRLPPSWRTRNH